MVNPPFRAPLTFLDLPLAGDFGQGDIAVVGLPFDCGNDATRFGARLGPNAVRQASILTGALLEDAEPNPLHQRRVVDAGNVDLPLSDIHGAFAAIEKALDAILDAGATPLTLGGDGAVSLPVMRAVARRHPSGVVQSVERRALDPDVAGSSPAPRAGPERTSTRSRIAPRAASSAAAVRCSCTVRSITSGARPHERVLDRPPRQCFQPPAQPWTGCSHRAQMNWDFAMSASSMSTGRPGRVLPDLRPSPLQGCERSVPCGRGGTGRRAVLKPRWALVPMRVRAPPPAPPLPS